MSFVIKRRDTRPSLLYALSPTSTDLTGAAVRFSMRLKATGIIKVSQADAVVVTATGTPTVRYDWQAGDTDDAGTFDAEFEVTYPDAGVETFPNDRMIVVSIAEDVA